MEVNMDIDREKKIETLNSFCEKHDSCRECPLDKVNFSTGRCAFADWDDMTDSDIDRAYNEVIDYAISAENLSRDKKIAMLDAFCDDRDCSVCPFAKGHPTGRCTIIALRFFDDDKLDETFKTAFPNYKKVNCDYWSNICEMQRKQTKKGIKKYGQILEENTGMTIRERLEYLQEELIDGLMYIEHIKTLLVPENKNE